MKYIRNIIFVLCVILVLNTVNYTVYADSVCVDVNSFMGKVKGIDHDYFSNLCKSLNGVVSGVSSYSNKERIITFYPEQLSEDNTERKTQVNNLIITVNGYVTLGDVNLQNSIRNRVNNKIKDMLGVDVQLNELLNEDTGEDLKDSMVSLSAITKKYVNPVLGVAVYFLVIAFVFSMVLDICYLLVPTFRWFMNNGKDDKPKLITKSAWKAIQEVEVEESSKGHILIIWGKHQAIAIIVFAIILRLVISGRLYSVLDSLLGLFSGILG